MAKIPDGTLRIWHDTEVIDATEYTRERELLRIAVNDNDERISTVEAAVEAVQLDETQITKITNNEGNVKIAINDTSGNLLVEILNAGIGMHTFYAVGGALNLPPSGLSVRGFAHITGVNPYFGWVQAYDYKGNVFTNYVNNNVWTGWKESFGGVSLANAISFLNNAVDSGFFYVQPNATNSPTGNAGNLIVMALDWQKNIITQIFVDTKTGIVYTRARDGFKWTTWSGHEDTGWATLTLGAGLTVYATGTNLRWRRINNVVYVTGAFTGDLDWDETVATLPVGARPSYTHHFIMPTSMGSNKEGRDARYTIGTDGRIIFSTTSDGIINTSAWYPINTSFPV